VRQALSTINVKKFTHYSGSDCTKGLPNHLCCSAGPESSKSGGVGVFELVGWKKQRSKLPLLIFDTDNHEKVA
jgi:hypothetical protein